MNEPTPRQRDLLEFIERFDKAHSYAPTLEEMAESLDISKTRAVQLLEELDEKGLVSSEAMKPRTVRLTEAGTKVLKRAA